MKINTETCTKRGRQQTATCGCTNQRERIQIYLDAACRRSLIDHNIDAVIFHRRIKIFLHHRRQPMNFINKKHVVRFEAGQYTCQVTRFIKYRTGSYLETYAQFVGYDIAECCFSQSGRAVKQHMVQRLATQAGSFHKYAQIVHHLVLPAEILKIQRTESVLEITFSAGDGLLVAYIKIFLFHSRFLCFLQNN